MRDNDLGWRLASIHAELDNLPMFAAAWPSMIDDHRAEVRLRWVGLVCEPIIAIRWHWRRYAMWGEAPDWWCEIEQTIADNQFIIEFMDLPMPDMSVPQRSDRRLSRFG